MTITERLRERAYAWRNREAIARARRVAAASSADVAALRKAIGILSGTVPTLYGHPEYEKVQSAIVYLNTRLRDAHLWQEGAL